MPFSPCRHLRWHWESNGEQIPGVLAQTGQWQQSAFCHLFFTCYHMHLREWLSDKLWPFRLGFSAQLFLKMNQVSLLLQGIFITNDKIPVFMKKLHVWKTCFCHSVLDSFPGLSLFHHLMQINYHNCWVLWHQ